MIFTIKNTIEGWPDEVQGIVFKNWKPCDFLSNMIKTSYDMFPLITSEAKTYF